MERKKLESLVEQVTASINEVVEATGKTVANSANFFENSTAVPDGTKRVTILGNIAPIAVLSRGKVSLAYKVKFDDKDGTLSKNFIFGGAYTDHEGRCSLRDLKPRVDRAKLADKFEVARNLTVKGADNAINVAVFVEDITLDVDHIKHPYVPVQGTFSKEDDNSVLTEMSKSESYTILV